MRKSNKILIFSGISILFLALLLISNTGASEGDLWNVVNAIRTGVGHLQDRVLVLESAPQNTLHLEDASGQDLGIVLDMNVGSSVNAFDTFFPEEGFYAGFNDNYLSEIVTFKFDKQLYFEGIDCTGNALISAVSIPENIVYSSFGNFYIPINLTQTISQSHHEYGNGTCLNAQNNWTFIYLENISGPFNFPLAHPLKVVVK
jgi:hypothetical protein